MPLFSIQAPMTSTLFPKQLGKKKIGWFYRANDPSGLAEGIPWVEGNWF